jgi:hypothetical protein
MSLKESLFKTVRVDVRNKISACITTAAAVLAGCSPLRPNLTPALSFSSSLNVAAESLQKLIIFVHGVFGDQSLTWINRSGVSWPDLMEADDAFREFVVLRVRYDTPLLTRVPRLRK